MTISDYENVLVTAWNDSGAGRLMRLMDSADQTFVFPFELLLGAEATLGIQNEARLVSGKYRWNVFRDTQQIEAAFKQERHSHNMLIPSESELNDWLEAKKFEALSRYRDRAKAFVRSLESRSPDQRQLLRTNEVLAYIKAMKAVFNGRYATFNLVHSPCAALDCESPHFWNIFSKAILVVIDPKWGFGNMHARNYIPPRRYFERWLRINQASLQLKQKHPQQVLILHSSANAAQQIENVERVHHFLGIGTMNEATRIPTLLGEAIGNTGFPFGGILNWDVNMCQNSVNEANALLSSADNHTAALLDQCTSLYKLLDS